MPVANLRKPTPSDWLPGYNEVLNIDLLTGGAF